eukprot:CAMPEP_0113229798 /NCGR_PEP_ID=MMETSP0008_2-20120614/545_1 /TAXON_ID=97485 /ORGANISM="Prymnesium parvum" /LENGTH=101 /DNA_ID=CAMNT_0000076343 /DNA_START=355 /DNA_END=657 /DNA_ORIENTATION=+ /assembly_acc=CAM_ASM_000153
MNGVTLIEDEGKSSDEPCFDGEQYICKHVHFGPKRGSADALGDLRVPTREQLRERWRALARAARSCHARLVDQPLGVAEALPLSGKHEEQHRPFLPEPELA